MSLSPNTTIANYKIISKIGEGAQGEVYKAEDEQLQRPVVIKILPPAFTNRPGNLERFEREARLASSLDHPNICTVYQFAKIDDVQFIAMQFVEGRTVRQLVGGRPLELKSALRIAIQVADALSAAHNRGIIHRDIKAGNVMVMPSGQVKVLDFGLAKLLDEPGAESADKENADLTLLGIPYGTASYAAPEQALGDRVDKRADIFSTGVLVYELVTGVLPFRGKSALDVRHALVNDQPTPIAKMGIDHVPPRLQPILDRAMAKDPQDRYQNIESLRDDLRSVLQEIATGDSSGVTLADVVEPPVHINSSNRFSKRTPWLSTSRIKQHKLAYLVAVLVLAGIAGTLTAYLFYRSRNREKTIASIAVMPFVNESNNADMEYLSDGITETLISSLSQLPNLTVKARSSVFRYKGKETNPKALGRELNVQAILNGRVAERGDQLTLTLELVEAETENIIWSEQYNRKGTDLIALQSEIARDVSTKLKTKLSNADEQKLAKSYTANPEAYQLYLRGRFYWNKRTDEALKKSVEYFKQAIEKDPNYALAYAGLADGYALIPIYSGGSPHEYFPKAKAAAKRALEIDDTVAEAHASLAVILWNYDWNFAEANKELQRALELNPNYATAHAWYGQNLACMTRFDEGIAEIQRALELDPLSLIINSNLGQVYIWARQYDKAIEQLRRTVEMDQNFYMAHWMLGVAYEMKGSFPEAIAEYQKAHALNSDPSVDAHLIRTYAISGRKNDALNTLGQLKATSEREYVSPYNFAIVYLALDEKDQAFQWLDKGYEDRAGKMGWLKVDPALDNLRADPRFADLIKRVGLP